MSLINLRHRLTRDLREFDRYSRSSDSLIYVDREIEPGDGDASLDLTVGEAWFHGGDNTEYRIQGDGLSLKPDQSCVVETNEQIGVPANAFGLVTGKGKFIFQGVLVSPCKIDPGFFQSSGLAYTTAVARLRSSRGMSLFVPYASLTSTQASTRCEGKVTCALTRSWRSFQLQKSLRRF